MSRFVKERDLEFGGHTDVGRRAHNEDMYLIDRDLGLLLVADGVGGHQSGEIASSITCEVLRREIAAGASLSDAIERANTEVSAAAQTGRGKPGMGSTVVALLMTEDGYEIAWVGDSRAYLWDGKLSLLTRDHSFVESQLASGQISLEEARTHPRRNVILQAVGLQGAGDLEVGTNSGRLAPNSRLLLCSDGVTDLLDNAQLCLLLADRTNAHETCQRLVSKAFQSGSSDNATAVLVAHNGIPDDPPRICSPAWVAWVYDPASGGYVGLPDFTMHPTDTESEAEKTQVLRVKPGFAGTAGPANPLPAAKKIADSGGRRWRYLYAVALTGVVLAGLAYWLY